MRAFVIAQENSFDQAMVGEYRHKVVESIASFGGKFVVRGGALTVVEGEWPYERTVVVEVPLSGDGGGVVSVIRLPESAPAAPQQHAQQSDHCRRRGLIVHNTAQRLHDQDSPTSTTGTGWERTP